jgi:threonine/homoserine/homoserine lactone efflux protein
VTLERWGLFVITETALCLTPGPAVLFVLSRALSRGRAASAGAAVGILGANIVYFALSATGLGAVLLASYELFSLVRWLGAAYLVWLGVRAFIGRRAPRSAAGPHEDATRRSWLNGFVLQAANPKALLFFVALLPQFIDPAGNIATQVLVLGSTSVAIELLVLLAYGAAAGRLHGLAVNARYARLADRIAGTMLVTAGVGATRA